MVERNDVTLVFVTIGRNNSAIELVRSAKRVFPKLRILVADQNGYTETMESFYQDHGVKILWLPWDCGLSFARNRAVEQIKTKYILLADDDFVFTHETNLIEALNVLDNIHDIGILGGSVIDVVVNQKGETQRLFRKWEKHIVLMEDLSTMITIPIDHLPLQTREIAGQKIYLCDMTSNWGVMRRDVFTTQQWNEAIKVNGEHEDFFLGLKVHSDWKVAYYPGLICDHHQQRTSGYGRLRTRLDGRAALAKQWNLTHHLELGVGLRDFSDYLAYQHVPMELPDVYERAMKSATGILESPKSQLSKSTVGSNTKP